MMTKSAEQFANPSKIAEDMVDSLKGLAGRGFDVEAVMATQRKNIEALANASRTAMDGANAVGKRQAEMFHETMSETAQSLQSLTTGGSPFDTAARQAELMRQGCEKALRNMREIAEMVSKAQLGTMELINDRVVQSINELKHASVKPADAPAASTSH